MDSSNRIDIISSESIEFVVMYPVGQLLNQPFPHGSEGEKCKKQEKYG